MKDMGIVQGSAEAALPLIVGKTTVYVHTDIKTVPVIDPDTGQPTDAVMYEYHEVQYDKDEYIKLQADKLTEQEQTITETQLALCDVYEWMG